MAQEPDYDPVECPVEGCSYRDAPRSVAAHVSGTDDERHDWDWLPHDGARAFVMAEKERQLADRGEALPGDGATADASGAGAVDADSAKGDGADPGASAGDGAGSAAGEASAGGDAASPSGDGASEAAEAADAAEHLDTTFADDALAVLSLLRRYGTTDLDDLDTFRLVNLYALLSDLSSTADDARGQVRDALLAEIQDDRSVAADFGEINRNTYERRRLKDDETVREALDRAGIDPVAVMSLDKSKVEEAVEAGRLDAESVFDAEEHARIRRVAVAEDRRDALLAELDPEVRELLGER